MKSAKFFLAPVFLLCFAACGLWQSAENTNPEKPIIIEEMKTGIPFETREPDAFQTEIVVANFLNGEKSEKIYFIARSGNKSLTVFNRGEKTEHAVLTDGAKMFFLDKNKKTFRETESKTNNGQAPDEALEFLTIRWLNRAADAGFEKLGTENNRTSYRVRFGNSNASEVILTYDETVKLPVKQEFYSTPGEEKILTMTVELKNFQAPADEKLFVLPQDYKRAETR